MLIKTRRSFVIILATVLVVGFAIMAMVLTQDRVNTPVETDRVVRELNTQSDSNSVDEIEDDLLETDFTDIDTELQDIEKELNTGN